MRHVRCHIQYFVTHFHTLLKTDSWMIQKMYGCWNHEKNCSPPATNHHFRPPTSSWHHRLAPDPESRQPPPDLTYSCVLYTGARSTTTIKIMNGHQIKHAMYYMLNCQLSYWQTPDSRKSGSPPPSHPIRGGEAKIMQWWHASLCLVAKSWHT